jgi:hypothetical protein
MSTDSIARLCTAFLACTLVLTACDGPRSISPEHPTALSPRSAAVASVATRSHSEFDISREADFYLSCIDEMTHWVISGHVSIDVVLTPTGTTSIRVQGNSNEAAFYLVRANGVRYDMIGQGSTQEHDFAGPVSFLNIAEPKVFRAADGDVLVTNYHLLITFDANGDPVSVIANGACP